MAGNSSAAEAEIARQFAVATGDRSEARGMAEFFNRQKSKEDEFKPHHCATV
jgi:hypothetical protein